jgi:hypothetical protein
MVPHLNEHGPVDTYAFVVFDMQYKRMLRILCAMPLIGSHYTNPERRGHSSYPRMLHTLLQLGSSRFADSQRELRPELFLA